MPAAAAVIAGTLAPFLVGFMQIDRAVWER